MGDTPNRLTLPPFMICHCGYGGAEGWKSDPLSFVQCVLCGERLTVELHSATDPLYFDWAHVLALASGFEVVPLNAEKKPARKEW